MGGKLPPVVAAARKALSTATEPGEFVLVACSGGADSLALAAAAAFLNRKKSLRVGAVIIDHQMQQDSHVVANRAAEQCTDLGLEPVLVLQVEVANDSEESARNARYAAFEQALVMSGATRILLGHTLDDQAEQVLLGLARGSGTLSLAGMPAVRGPYLRPFLSLDRTAIEQICVHEAIDYWVDPTNAAPKYLRNKIRNQLMPVLKDVLGTTIPTSLARTAILARRDAEYLDQLAATQLALLEKFTDPTTLVLSIPALRELPDAVRGRVLRAAVSKLGAPSPNFERLEALETLLFGSKSAGPIQMDGNVQVFRIPKNRSIRGSVAMLKLTKNASTRA
ncbi:tRNA lysidine(34) synthetase TilS [Arthrobacter sp. MYb227]|uniref:tRNA lysidine(34) synthetase TilS n=1 Tax=Arthrobacter sp. MYb227 TaxID=1848601 RepID=UPI0015E3A53C|nr:tRNA lysidine(34) synthetase TilS [Arthrobacter sp. MYb227]